MLNKSDAKPFLLVSGASGFIGSAFLKHALAQGWRVRVITRKPWEWRITDTLDVFEGDLITTKDWTKALQGVQIVVHAAAEIKDTELMSAINVQGSISLLKAAVKSGVNRWIQLSSVGAYGPITSGMVTEEWPDNPIGPYEVSKTNFDEVLRHAMRERKIEVCIVRPSNVYGFDMRNQSIKQLIQAIRKGWFAYIGPRGAAANYVHVSDVVQAISLCVVLPQAANQTYIVSASAQIEDMINALAEGAGLEPPTKRISLVVAKVLAIAFQKWSRWPLTLSRVQAMSLQGSYSTKKIENELGWKQSINLYDGMKNLAEKYRHET